LKYIRTITELIVRGYRSALYLGIGFAATSLALCLLFVKIKKDEREGWDEPAMTGDQMAASSGNTTLSGVIAPEDEVKCKVGGISQ
jgi:hypothetical protein